MRTTIDLPEHLLVEAKQLAAKRHLSFTRIVEESVRLYLSEERMKRVDRRLEPLPLLRQPVPVAGVALDDTSRLLELD